MSSNDNLNPPDTVAIRVSDVSKCYPIYQKPQDRLKQSLLPRLQRLAGQQPKHYFKEFWALHNVSFTINRGETVGIIGRNGSGKSTLLQMICDTLTPTSGEISTSGRIAALLELGSGFNPEFSGRENVHMNAALLGLSPQEIEERYEDIVAFADIGDFIDQPIKTYSSGMMVRLAFAVIAHVNADILIVDEALAVGDAFFTQKCMRFLRNFMKEGTVLFVSHDTAAIRSLCSRAIWIDHGKLVADGLPKEICETYLEALYASQQGKSMTAEKNAERPAPATCIIRDQRDSFINHSNLRNDLRIFEFNPEAESFGKRGATITDIRLTETSLALAEPANTETTATNSTPQSTDTQKSALPENSRLSWVVGGEAVTLRIEARASKPLFSPIIGFYITDRHGQPLFGDNTYLSYCDTPLICEAGELLVAEFSFQMPRLAPGDYAVTAAIAEGTQHDHVQHHWIHDAVVFRSETSSVASGIIGIPMARIQLTTEGTA